MEESSHLDVTRMKRGKKSEELNGHLSNKQVDEDVGQILHRKMSDVGAYSYSSLCAVSLLQLFEDKWHKDFKSSTLKVILTHLHLPEQASDSVTAIMEGQGFDDPQPYVDIILEEPILNKSGIPVVSDLVSLAISDGCYDSRMRVLIKHVAWQLRVSWDDLEEVEVTMAETIDSKQKEYEMSEEEVKEKKKQSTKAKAKRIALISLATIGGGTLIGLTGGLAAPFVAAGAGAIIGGAGAAALGSAAGVAIIGSLFGVAGAGLTGYKMKKRVGAVEEFVFEPLVFGSSRLQVQHQPAKQLHVTIAVTGWLSTNMQDYKIPWFSLAESREQYSLRWESKYLLQLGKALDYILSGAMSMATQEALKYTILSGIISAIAWPATLLSVASVIDNPWSVCVQRATAAGKELAEVLLSREQGKRPVTLIGFSLGARVVFSCLEELSKRKGSEGIVEDAVLLGAPVSGDPAAWAPLARVIGGKIINGYCRGDWLLKFLYRTASVQLRTIAGLEPVKWDNRRVHNIDLSDVVTGHKDYMKQLDIIMKVVGVRTKDDVSLRKPSGEKNIQRHESTDSFTSSASEDEIFDDSLDTGDTVKDSILKSQSITPEDERSRLEIEKNDEQVLKNLSDQSLESPETYDDTVKQSRCERLRSEPSSESFVFVQSQGQRSESEQSSQPDSRQTAGDQMYISTEAESDLEQHTCISTSDDNKMIENQEKLASENDKIDTTSEGSLLDIDHSTGKKPEGSTGDETRHTEISSTTQTSDK